VILYVKIMASLVFNEGRMNIINGSKQFSQVVNDLSREVHILVNHKQPPYCAYKLTVPLVEHQIKTHSHSLSYYSKENVFFF